MAAPLLDGMLKNLSMGTTFDRNRPSASHLWIMKKVTLRGPTIIMLPLDIKRKVVDRLIKTNPYKIILFGSHAYGVPDKDSDIDLLVVTHDDFLPGSFSEKNAIYLKVAGELLDIMKEVPIDLIVHTRAMHEKFIGLQSQFSKTIAAKGIVLHEKSD